MKGGGIKDDLGFCVRAAFSFKGFYYYFFFRSTLPLKLVQLNGQVCDFNEIPKVLVRTVIKTKPGCQKQT